MSIESEIKQEEPRNKRLHRFAEVETLAKRLFGGTEWLPPHFEDQEETPRTITAQRSFQMAEEFLAERDRRKAAK